MGQNPVLFDGPFSDPAAQKPADITPHGDPAATASPPEPDVREYDLGDTPSLNDQVQAALQRLATYFTVQFPLTPARLTGARVLFSYLSSQPTQLQGLGPGIVERYDPAWAHLQAAVSAIRAINITTLDASALNTFIDNILQRLISECPGVRFKPLFIAWLALCPTDLEKAKAFFTQSQAAFAPMPPENPHIAVKENLPRTPFDALGRLALSNKDARPQDVATCTDVDFQLAALLTDLHRYQDDSTPWRTYQKMYAILDVFQRIDQSVFAAESNQGTQRDPKQFIAHCQWI